MSEEGDDKISTTAFLMRIMEDIKRESEKAHEENSRKITALFTKLDAHSMLHTEFIKDIKGLKVRTDLLWGLMGLFATGIVAVIVSKLFK